MVCSNFLAGSKQMKKVISSVITFFSIVIVILGGLYYYFFRVDINALVESIEYGPPPRDLGHTQELIKKANQEHTDDDAR